MWNLPGPTACEHHSPKKMNPDAREFHPKNFSALENAKESKSAGEHLVDDRSFKDMSINMDNETVPMEIDCCFTIKINDYHQT